MHAAPVATTASRTLAMQRTFGNRATVAWLSTLRRSQAATEAETVEEHADQPPMQAKMSGGDGAPPPAAGPGPGRGGGAMAMPIGVREQMERAFGADFGAVRIHAGSARAAGMGALAFTQGDEIHVAPGRWTPQSKEGQRLLGHELAHVMQQRAGHVAAPSRAMGKAAPGRAPLPAMVNAEPELEAEADRMGDDAAEGRQVSPPVAQPRGAAAGGAVIQPKFGFELELQVALSQQMTGQVQGKAVDDDDKTIRGARARGTADQLTVQDLIDGKPIPGTPVASDTLENKRRVLVGNVIYRWEENSIGQHEPPNTLRPVDVAEDKPGRWTKESDFKAVGTFDPVLTKREPIFRATIGTPFDVVEDHSGALAGTPAIIELVTDPREEFAQESVAIKPMERAAETAAEIAQKTENFTKAVQANQIFPGARPDLYLGGPEVEGQSTKASVQATYAVALSRMPEHMAAMADSKRISQHEPTILQGAILAAREAVSVIDELVDTKKMPNLVGLIHVICMYLVGGKDTYIVGQLKNTVPLLIRDHMSALTALTEVANDEETRAALVDVLLKATGRKADEPLFHGDFLKGPKVDTWLKALLNGRPDPQMERWDQAGNIPPEPIGPLNADQRPRAPVMEERQVPSLEFKGLVPANEWVQMAKDYRAKLQNLNRPVAEEKQVPAPPQQPAMPAPGPSASAAPNQAPEQKAIKKAFGPGLPPQTKITVGGKPATILKEDASNKRYAIKYDGAGVAMLLYDAKETVTVL